MTKEQAEAVMDFMRRVGFVAHVELVHAGLGIFRVIVTEIEPG